MIWSLSWQFRMYNHTYKHLKDCQTLRRGCLVLGSLLFTLAPILTHFTLNWGVPAVCFSYGVVYHMIDVFNLLWLRLFLKDGSRSSEHHHAPHSSHSCHLVPKPQGIGEHVRNLQPVRLGLQVLGIVTSGFGLSSTVFSPLQTLLINPSNLPPLRVKLIQV